VHRREEQGANAGADQSAAHADILQVAADCELQSLGHGTFIPTTHNVRHYRTDFSPAYDEGERDFFDPGFYLRERAWVSLYGPCRCVKQVFDSCLRFG